jgi:hypothetical protein
MILAFLALAGLAFAFYKKFGKASLNAVFLKDGRYIYWLWGVVYMAGLFVQRSMSHFDTIDARFILMGTVPLTILLTGFAVKLLENHPKVVIGLAGMLVLVVLGREVYTTASLPYASQTTAIQNSPNLSWIRDNTTSRDLIIGDNTVYVPFFFDYPEAASYSPYPYTEYFTEDALKDITASRCSKFDHIYLIIRTGETNDQEKWTAKYGGFLSGLVFHRETSIQSVRFVQDTGESVVYAVNCP